MHNKTTSPCSANSIEDAAQFLAEIAVTAREQRTKLSAFCVKRADGPAPTVGSMVDNTLNSVKDWGQHNVLDPVAAHVTAPVTNMLGRYGIDEGTLPTLRNHLTWSLLGGAGGAGLGLASQMFGPQKKRKPLSGLLTGALLGGGVGLGASLIANHGPFAGGVAPESPPPAGPAGAAGPAGPPAKEPPLIPPAVRLWDHPNAPEVHPGQDLAASAAGLGASGATDFAGYINARMRGRPYATVGELRAALPEMLKNPASKDMAEYIGRVSNAHGDAGLKAVLDGKTPILTDLTVEKPVFDSTVGQFRDKAHAADYTARNAARPPVDVDLFNTNVNKNIHELARRFNPTEVARIAADPALTPDAKTQAFHDILNANLGSTEQVGGLTAQQLTRLRAEALKMKDATGTGAPDVTVDALKRYTEGGYAVPEVPGKYDRAGAIRVNPNNQGSVLKNFLSRDAATPLPGGVSRSAAWQGMTSAQRNLEYAKLEAFMQRGGKGNAIINLPGIGQYTIPGHEVSMLMGDLKGGTPELNVDAPTMKGLAGTPDLPKSPYPHSGTLHPTEIAEFRRALTNPDFLKTTGLSVENARLLASLDDARISALANKLGAGAAEVGILGKRPSFTRRSLGDALEAMPSGKKTSLGALFGERFGRGGIGGPFGRLPAGAMHLGATVLPALGNEVIQNMTQPKRDEIMEKIYGK